MKKILACILSLMMVLSAAGACAESEESVLVQMAQLEWSFSSGAGAWSTEMTIRPDGSFSGLFHDSDMGDAAEAYPDGTVYTCAFSGQMSCVQQVNEHTWEIRIDSLAAEENPGQETIEDGMRMITAEPYGISEGDNMLLYGPGTPAETFTEDMAFWAHLADAGEMPEELTEWFLYSEKNQAGFVGTEAVGGVSLANPWTDLTEEELLKVSGVPFQVPEGAEDIVYRWLGSGNLAEVQFSLDGDEFCLRIQPDALQEGQLDNISGMYFLWEHEEPVQIADCEGTIGLAQTGSGEWVELCLWYDAAPGLMYSLSVYTTEPDGLDLTAVAEMVFVPAQGDV